MRFSCHSPCHSIPALLIFLLPGSLLLYSLLAFTCNDKWSEVEGTICLHLTPNMAWLVVLLISRVRYKEGNKRKKINLVQASVWILSEMKCGTASNFHRRQGKMVLLSLHQCSSLPPSPTHLRRDAQDSPFQQSWTFPYCTDTSCNESFTCV